ncbi:MAG: hypothetical protein FWF90_18290, partial [Promicromonosporaceae bacterium]|nr:hypothetical protein [Promicromonosporaceae bacterium]
MRTGVLFCETDGYILLSNARMETLIKVIFTENVRRNANHFMERFISGRINPACQKTEFEGQIVCLLPDETAWMFTRTELRVKRRTYIQLSATDITERWRLTAELQAKNTELRQRNEELEETIANLHILSREREAQRAKMRAHDVLGQSLTVLLRGIRGGQLD